MIEVEHTSGAIIEFPDGTPQDVMAKAMRQLDIPAQGQKQPGFNPVLGTLYNVAQGASMYGADEGLAGLASVGSDTTYDDALSRARGLEKQFASEHPVLAVGGQVAGGIVSPVVRAVGAAGSAAMKGARLLQGAGLFSNIGRAGAAGVGYGAAGGFGAGEGGVENRLESAGVGAAIGGIAGPVMQGVAEAAKPALKYGLEGARQVGNAMGYGSAESMANRVLADAVRRSGSTAEDMIERIKNSQAPLTVADVGGVPMQRLARAVATQEGAGSDFAIKALQERQAGRGDRLVNQFRNYVSPMDDATMTVEELAKYRSAQGAKDYEAAMSVGNVTSPNIERMLQEPIIQSGLNRGREIQRIEAAARGTPFDPNDYQYTFTGGGVTKPSYSELSAGVRPQQLSEVTESATPNMRALQAAKIGLDDILEQSRNPITGRLDLDQKGRAINELRKSYLDELNAINPAFAEANRNWGDTTSLMNAVNKGRSFLRGDVDLTTQAISQLTPAEKAMLRVGAGRELRRLVETTRGNNNALNKFFGTPEQTRRLRSLFDDETQFNSFVKGLDDERLAQSTEASILGGSQTANKQQELDMLAGRGQIPTSTGGALSGLLRKAEELTIGGARTRRAEALAPILLGNNQQKMAEALLQIGQTNNKLIGRQQVASDIGTKARNALALALAGNGGN
jgi:hypothetical protein